MTEQSSSNPRKKFDLAQAELMRRRLKNPSSLPVTSTRLEQDIQLGFQGLEDAQRLEQQAQDAKALRLYELSIELLLQCLKQTTETTLITERVTVALEHAEACKARIVSLDQQPAGESPTNSTSWRDLASQLTSAIARVSLVSSSAAGGTTLKSATSTTSAVGVTSAATSPPDTASVAKQQPRKHSRLDYDKDPLVLQVKKELYVDPSEVAKVTWDDIVGLDDAKQVLQESAIWPLLRPDLFLSSLRKPQNILLYGPPGTGKTLLVKAVAHESQCLLFQCTSSTLTSKWMGEGEKLVRILFELARDVAPSLIFLDELDALLSTRGSNQEHEASRRFKTQVMIQMDGLTSSGEELVLVVGCTNCPWHVDDAILRRFPRRLYIPLPNVEARQVLLEKLLAKAGKHSLTKRQISSLAQKLEHYSGSDIANMASQASLGPLRSSVKSTQELQQLQEQDLRPMSLQDFDLSGNRPSVSLALLKRYDEWQVQQEKA
jgi:spastin